MKLRSNNIYIFIILIVAIYIIFMVNNKYENYSTSTLLRPDTYERVDKEIYQRNKPLRTSNNEKINKKYNKNLKEDFNNIYDNGYHGGFIPPYFPYTTSYIPQTQRQDKQILNKLINQYPSIYGDPYRYPNVTLPAHVIGCGGRRGACMGGSQIPIPNTLPPVNISDENIAPVNLTVRGFDEGLQQVGTIQKVFGNDNLVYPLFGRRKYRNDNKWEYFVKFGKFGVILPLIPLRNCDELNTNDEVHIQSQKDKYRVTIYDSDIPQYLPFT